MPPVRGFPYGELKRPLSSAARTRIARQTRALLAWQRKLEGWPRAVALPDATPFVALFAGGRLTGCFGSMEGAPGERLARAFLSALGDMRYGGVHPAERADLTASVAYLRDARRRAFGDVARMFELGTHGLAAVVRGKDPALLLPSVAVDERAGFPDLVTLLARKMGITPAAIERATLYTFEVDSVVIRPSGASSPGRSLDAIDAAAGWLARQIDAKGRVRFGIDARARTEHARGEFFHGRAAVVVQALAAHGGYPQKVRRARGWLGNEIRAALEGRRISDWPKDPAEAAGSIALAVLAGADLARELVVLAADESLAQNSWHAAQVVAAIGRRAPPSLWKACVDDLSVQPWAPWTAIAAHALGDSVVEARVCATLAASIRSGAPYRGAENVTPVPEMALTAVALEALGRSRSPRAREAATRAADFLSSAQFLGEKIPAALAPALAHGAFPLSSVVDLLRCDVTAHALLALLAVRNRR